MPAHIPYRAEVGRKALHLLALVLPLGVWLVGTPVATWALAALTLLALTGDMLRARSAAFNSFIERVFGWMMRQEEKAPTPGPLVLNGATWVLASLLVLVLLFPLQAALPAFAAFMVGDAAAALVGRRWGRTRWPGTQRTLEGSAAFFAFAALLLLALRVPLLPSLACALVCAAVEALPLALNDNLRVPLAGALVLLLMG